MAFGEIEVITLQALGSFPRDPIFESLASLPLGRRTSLIVDIVKPWSDPERKVKEFIAQLKVVDRLAVTRNLVAHNPAAFAVYEEEGTGDVRLGELHISSVRSPQRMLTYEELKTAADEAEALVPDLWRSFYACQRIAEQRE